MNRNLKNGGPRGWLGRMALGLALLLLPVTKAAAVVAWTNCINTNYVITITNAPYYATNDGITDNAPAISNAIVAAAAGGTTNGLIGGTVCIPAPGFYLSGPLQLKNNVNLQIDAGAVLRMLPYGTYPGAPYTNDDDATVPNFITAASLTNIAISGSGAIDGQGAPWWPGYKTNNRPRMIFFSGCKYQLIQNVTLSNSPMFHIAISSSKGNATVRGVTVRAPASDDSTNPSHNTDACDVSGTNILVQNCDISTGDDDFTCGGGTSDVLVTNNTYGNGHGVSIGSYTQGVSNILVINCTFNGTDNGIRIKSDNDRSGLVRNISYCNLGMTNVNFPIQVYGYYNEIGTPSSISPWYAATQAVATVVSTTPVFRDITFSNITATSVSGYPIGLVWARTELPATNIIFNKVNISGNRNFYLYNVVNAQFIDCNLKTTATSNTFALFNASFTVTNSTFSTNLVKLEGLTTNGYGNSLAFYNACGSLKNTNALDAGPLTLGDSLFTVSNNLNLSASTLNYVLDSSTNRLAVTGNLTLGGTINITTNAAGFTTGTNTLMTYAGTLGGTLPALGTTPGGNYTYTLDTNTAGQVNLVVAIPVTGPPAPANLTAVATNARVALTWSPSVSATSYNVKRSTVSGGAYPILTSGVTATNYSDTQVVNGTTYYYVVSATNSSGESANSAEVSATPQAPAVSVVTTNVFTDTFSASTVDATTQTGPTGASTCYEVLSSKSWSPTPTIAAGHLKFGIAATGSGCIEVQALFTNSPILLTNTGDSISLLVTFTNTSGLLTQAGAMGFGLYASSGNYPVPGGLNGTATGAYSTNATGNAQTWSGYVGQLAFTGSSSQIMTRSPQTGTTNNNQDVVTSGSGSSSYGHPAATTVGSASSTPSLTLTAGSPYTEILTITLSATSTLAITNSLYSGTSTNGTLLSQFGGTASGSTYLTNGFDALAVGWRAQASTSATAIDLNQIAINTTRTIYATNAIPPAATTNTLQSSANPSTYGSAVTFTATISPAPTNGESITFLDGANTLGVGTLSSGLAALTIAASPLTVGTHAITAVYAGDGAYAASTSAALSQTVNARTLTVSGLSISNKVYDGTAAATLSTNGCALNTVVSSDTVTLLTNGCTATFASANVGTGISVTVSGLALGGAQATNYNLTQPAGLTADITAAGSALALVASANPVAHLSAVSFTAGVTPASLTGTVTFATNGVAFDHQTLSGGTASSLATAVLPRGTNAIAVWFGGSGNYAGSTNTLNEVVTNNPPTASPSVYYRLAGNPLTIALTNLATNWSDPDGDPLSLAGVSSPSTNGAGVTQDSASVYYRNPNDVTDRFEYTISDGQGGTNNGSVTVRVARQAISVNPATVNGRVTLDFSGIPGSVYWVEAATNLTPPVPWIPLSTNTADTNGGWQFTDSQVTNFIQRYYRTQLGQ
jgi:hypothetical protein